MVSIHSWMISGPGWLPQSRCQPHYRWWLCKTFWKRLRDQYCLAFWSYLIFDFTITLDLKTFQNILQEMLRGQKKSAPKSARWQRTVEIFKGNLLVGSTGLWICWILSASISERISSLPVAMNSFKTFSFSFPALRVFCHENRYYYRMLTCVIYILIVESKGAHRNL